MDIDQAQMIMGGLDSMNLYQVSTDTLLQIHEIVSEHIENESEWFQEYWDESIEDQFESVEDELMIRGEL